MSGDEALDRAMATLLAIALVYLALIVGPQVVILMVQRWP